MMTEDNYIYMYCVTQKPPVLPPAEDETEELSCVRGAGLFAVVGKATVCEFGEEQMKQKISDPEWLKQHVERHERVIEAVMRSSSVIPSKFGVVFFNVRNVQSFLEKNGEELAEKFNDIEGREEWGVKIYCDKKLLRAHLAENNSAVTELDREINSSPPGKAYMLKQTRLRLIEDVTADVLNKRRKSFADVFQAASCHLLSNPLPPQEPDGRNGEIILSLAALAKKNSRRDFFAALETLQLEFGESGFSFVCSGPWPPYNFSKITTA